MDDAEKKMLASAVSRFTAFADLVPDDFAALAKLAKGRRRMERGEFVCHEGDPPNGLYLILKGWTASSVTFANGARQLLKVHLPGDMLGMPSLALRRCAETTVALTDLELGIISRQELGRLFETDGRLAALMFLVSQEERVTMMDRLASVGATDAPQRLAALVLHIHARVRRSDPATGDTLDMPLSQEDIAALIGITSAHLSRTLRLFRSEKLIAWTRHRLTILDAAALVELAGLPRRELTFEPEWLPKRT